MTILPCPVSLPLMRLALMERVQYIAVHCSATRPTANIGAADIDTMHRARKFACIGYHYVIRRSGAVEKGRPERNAGAHVEGYNSKALGICLVGGIDCQGKAQNNFTPAQLDALRQLLAELKTRYPQAIVQGHRDFPNVAKDCPCFDVRAWLQTP
ncbi:MAG: N-acetylmuramoyl-L-alanine amidase [Fluviicoccus sp.]|uniref:N-acetylmuramoyl-L-alanine amidase n=1 Tax=Fluviicoccus sp. TaxID=2003552 RepID=UPI00272453C0|nr:N-acetylmuramoyl-L-alanine amidase [Fluviicoccus sp.]MDO8328871.1 N-acetylmuramoyl-L-alanine amidase [Fluviicoccus sp.]